jgi:hypothetical protein
MSLFIHRLFGIPVSYSGLFGRNLPEGELGQELEGDPSFPPTSIPFWPAWANACRNAVLATFVWHEYSVLDLGIIPRGGVYVMYGDGNVMPRLVHTRFIAVKHGHEACRFAVLDHCGAEVPYRVIARGTEQNVLLDVLEFVLVMDVAELSFLYVVELNALDSHDGGLAADERERASKRCFEDSVTRSGRDLVTFV